MNIKIIITIIVINKMSLFTQKQSTGNYFDNVPGPYRHNFIPAIYEQNEQYYYGGGEFYFHYDMVIIVKFSLS